MNESIAIEGADHGIAFDGKDEGLNAQHGSDVYGVELAVVATPAILVLFVYTTARWRRLFWS